MSDRWNTNNYELIVTLYTDHVYIKVTNIINYLSYDKKIFSYEIIDKYINTLKDFMIVLLKHFKLWNNIKLIF